MEAPFAVMAEGRGRLEGKRALFIAEVHGQGSGKSSAVPLAFKRAGDLAVCVFAVELELVSIQLPFSSLVILGALGALQLGRSAELDSDLLWVLLPNVQFPSGGGHFDEVGFQKFPRFHFSG